MYLFKNIQRRMTRIGMNMVVYSFAGCIICMMSVLLVPKDFVRSYIVPIMYATSISVFLGMALTALGFMITIFVLMTAKQAAPKSRTQEFGSDLQADVEGFLLETESTMEENRFFRYLGHKRFCSVWTPNPGYSSDQRMYLCEEKCVDYILTFTVDATHGPVWSGTQLLPGDSQFLVEGDAEHWKEIAFSSKRKRTTGWNLKIVEKLG